MPAVCQCDFLYRSRNAIVWASMRLRAETLAWRTSVDRPMRTSARLPNDWETGSDSGRGDMVMAGSSGMKWGFH